MTTTRGIKLALSQECFLTELPNRLEHDESWKTVRGVEWPNQRLVDERRQPFQRLHFQPFRFSDSLAGFKRPATTENRKPPEQALLGLVEEVVAPGDRPSQGSLSFGQRSTARSQQGETALETRQHLLRRQHLDPRGSKFDGEWQPIQPSRYLCHRLSIISSDPEAWLDCEGALREQPHCLGAAQGLDITN